MKLSSIISVKNVLRVSGVVALAVGCPMMVYPGVAIRAYFGKRKAASEAEKMALKLTMRSMGIAIAANGIKAVTAPATKAALVGDLALEGLMCMFNWCSRASGEWKKAEGIMQTNMVFAIASTVCVAMQLASLRIGDLPDDAEAEVDKGQLQS